MRVVSVKFKGTNSVIYNSREYFYFTFFDVEEGDLVVVDTSTNGISVAKVHNNNVTDPADIKKATKYLVQKIEMEEYQKRVDDLKSLKELKSKMDAKVKELQDVAIYKMLAKEDAELANMLQAYESMTKEM